MRKKGRKNGVINLARRNVRNPQRLSFQKNPSEENREESRLKGENKVECKKWSAKGTYRKASADREPTTHLNTLGGQRPRADLIQVPTAKFRTWSQRGVSTDGGSYDYLRVRAESVSTFTFLQKWFRTSAKGETKSNENKISEEV